MECLVKATLLQHPKVTINGDELNLRLKKALALLYYLLVSKEATRMEMAGLLWGRRAGRACYAPPKRQPIPNQESRPYRTDIDAE